MLVVPSTIGSMGGDTVSTIKEKLGSARSPMPVGNLVHVRSSPSRPKRTLSLRNEKPSSCSARLRRRDFRSTLPRQTSGSRASSDGAKASRLQVRMETPRPLSVGGTAGRTSGGRRPDILLPHCGYLILGRPFKAGIVGQNTSTSHSDD